jgi:hypothetical protein
MLAQRGIAIGAQSERDQTIEEDKERTTPA